jgi:diguanylate cyclase (GGDEF)-like protein/PAS domain S-box-containing protein
MINTVEPLKQLLPADLSKLLEVCVDQLNDAIVITEAEPINKPGPRIVWANKIFYLRNGYTPDEVIGQSPRILQGPESDRATLDKLRTALEKWQSIRSELLNYRKDGSTYWNEFQIVPIANEKGWYTHWVSIQRDVTERKKIEEEVRQLALYDALTSLPNRRLLIDRLTKCIASSKRSHIYSALMFLDLDNFKPINDQYGHVAGDMLLIETANRLKACMREMDTVARFGGDEFVAILDDLSPNYLTARSQATTVAEKIRVALSEPYRFTMEATRLMVEHCCTVSIGLVIFNGSKGSQDDIMKWADTAMYEAKDAGRNNIRFYVGK